MALWTIKQVAEYFQVAPLTVWNWKKQGRIKAVQLAGKTLRFTQEEIDRFVKANTVTTKEQLSTTNQEQRVSVIEQPETPKEQKSIDLNAIKQRYNIT